MRKSWGGLGTLPPQSLPKFCFKAIKYYQRRTLAPPQIRNLIQLYDNN